MLPIPPDQKFVLNRIKRNGLLRAEREQLQSGQYGTRLNLSKVQGDRFHQRIFAASGPVGSQICSGHPSLRIVTPECFQGPG